MREKDLPSDRCIQYERERFIQWQVYSVCERKIYPVAVDWAAADPRASETSTMGLSMTTVPLRAVVEVRSSFSSLLGFLLSQSHQMYIHVHIHTHDHTVTLDV